MGKVACRHGATFNNPRATKVSVSLFIDIFRRLTFSFLSLLHNSECMVLGCLASWAVNVLFKWDALPFYLVHILVWFLSDWIMLSVVQVSYRISTRRNFKGFFKEVTCFRRLLVNQPPRTKVPFKSFEAFSISFFLLYAFHSKTFSLFRMDRYRLTSSTLLLAGYFESSPDLISFFVHYSIQQ